MVLIKKLFPIINLGCITIFIYFCVQSFYQIIGTYVPKSYDAGAAVKQYIPTNRPKRIEPISEYNNISKRNLFQTKTQAQIKKENTPPPPEPVKEEIKPTELKLELLGTVAGDAEYSYAFILDKKKRQQNLYQVGDYVQNAMVDEIRQFSVILKVGDGKEILFLDDNPEIEQFKTKNQASNEPETPEGKITLLRRDLNQSMRNINQLMSQIRIRPHFNRGRPDGLSVNNIKRHSIFNKMGLKNGDIIQGVNGKKIKTVDDVMSLYQQLNSVSDIDLEIKRRGKPLNMQYQIR